MSGFSFFYHSERKLDWDDFKARPHFGSDYAASIFTSFAWEGDPVVEDGDVKPSSKLCEAIVNSLNQ